MFVFIKLTDLSNIIFPYKFLGAIKPNLLPPFLKEHEKILSICSSGENPKDQIFFSIKAMSLEKVNTGIDSAFANGFIFKRDSLVKGPIINLGLTVLSIFFKFNSYLSLPVSK